MRLALLLVAVSSVAAGTNSFVHEFPVSGDLQLVLKDHLYHPLYWWPRTLVEYRIHFGEVQIPPDALKLSVDGQAAPLQLSDVHLKGGVLDSAQVCFFADLPSGGEHRFVLSRGASETLKPAVTERRDGNSIVLDTGAVRVRLPAVMGASGPIQQFSRDGRWVGSSRLIVPGRKVIAFDAVREESGPLFITYRLTWTLSGNASYTARVKAIAGYDFLSLREEMKGMDAPNSARVELSWDGFEPTHRQAPNHPYQKANASPGYARYDWEHIDEAAVGTQHGVSSGLGPDGELPFRLGAYQPWGAYVMLTSANFWDEKRGDAAGVFIDRIAQWQDHEYAIWASSNTLQVRYFYRDSKLVWVWPLATGTRSTGVAYYDHAKDIAAMEALDKLASHPTPYRDGQIYKANLSPMSHTMFLQNRYGTVDLDLVKDWVLEYPKEARQPETIFTQGQLKSANELERRVFAGSELIRDLMTQGTRQNAGFAPVPSRSIYDWFVDAFDRFRPQFTEKQRERLDAAYLLLAYTHAEEDYMPIKTMLSGHPNFLSDVKSAPGFFAFLFPEHPMASEWADEFEKFLELNTRYHTRPAVASWETKGGRWTENLGTYVWAFMRPAIRANYLLQNYVDGKNRFAIPQMAEIGDWLVNALSAPFNGEDRASKLGPDGKLDRHFWGMVTPENGPRRLHPPQGAHSARRMPPSSMWLLGSLLRNYDPLTAEHVMWAARPEDEDSEEQTNDPFRVMYPKAANHGTNPHLRSSAYTGYGMVLRSAVDTPEELSIHLQQIDEGPNYRWGVADEGGCGVIYFYAGGKSYSHNGREDVGDRQTHDTDFASTLGVWKNGAFRSIGRNVLEKPLRDLGFAQLAEITPRRGAGAYSWPEYQGRSVLLAGADYFAIYDHVFNDAVTHRFSWFTEAGEEMPDIRFVKGVGRDGAVNLTRVTTSAIKGFWQDGLGDSMAIVTHRKDLRTDAAAYGARVTGPGWVDRVMQSPVDVHVKEGGFSFDGRNGLIRDRSSGATELTVFDGSHIGGKGIELEPSAGMAVAAIFESNTELTGTVISKSGGRLVIRASGLGKFYVDGDGVGATYANGSWNIPVPAGKHHWQLTSKLPTPNAPAVFRTEESLSESLVYFQVSPGAASYRAQVSRDEGKTWAEAVTTATSPARIRGLAMGKVHVRLIASNSDTSSAPGPEFPIYITGQPAAHPDGLKVALLPGQVRASWGQVLGTTEYRLYRREVGSQDFQLVFHGLERTHLDRVVGVVPAFDEPGMSADAARPPRSGPIYEYAVSAVNGNGEGKRSTPVDTNPASWHVWDPKPGEPFRRRFTYNTTNYSQVGQEADTNRYYPRE